MTKQPSKMPLPTWERGADMASRRQKNGREAMQMQDGIVSASMVLEYQVGSISRGYQVLLDMD